MFRKWGAAGISQYTHYKKLDYTTAWMCIPQISINCKMLSYQYGPTFLKNAFTITNNLKGQFVQVT